MTKPGQLIVFSDPPLVAAYLLCCLLVSLSVVAWLRIYRWCSSNALDSETAEGKKGTKIPYGFSLFGLIIPFFLLSDLLSHFNAIRLKPDRLELVFPWPKPSVHIIRKDFQNVRSFSFRKGKGGMIRISTTDHVFESASVDDLTRIEIVQLIDSWHSKQVRE